MFFFTDVKVNFKHTNGFSRRLNIDLNGSELVKLMDEDKNDLNKNCRKILIFWKDIFFWRERKASFFSLLLFCHS